VNFYKEAAKSYDEKQLWCKSILFQTTNIYSLLVYVGSGGFGMNVNNGMKKNADFFKKVKKRFKRKKISFDFYFLRKKTPSVFRIT